MSDVDLEKRAYAVTMARRYFDGTLTMEAYVDMFGETADPLIDELVDLIVHEPRKGFLGVSERRYEEYRLALERVLTELQKAPAGVVPDAGAVKLKWLLFGWFLFLPFVAASAADHLAQIIEHFRGSGALSVWAFLGHSFGAVIMGLMTLLAVRALLYSSRRYRRQRERRRV